MESRHRPLRANEALRLVVLRLMQALDIRREDDRERRRLAWAPAGRHRAMIAARLASGADRPRKPRSSPSAWRRNGPPPVIERVYTQEIGHGKLQSRSRRLRGAGHLRPCRSMNTITSLCARLPQVVERLKTTRIKVASSRGSERFCAGRGGGRTGRRGRRGKEPAPRPRTAAQFDSSFKLNRTLRALETAASRWPSRWRPGARRRLEIAWRPLPCRRENLSCILACPRRRSCCSRARRHPALPRMIVAMNALRCSSTAARPPGRVSKVVSGACRARPNCRAPRPG